MNRIIVWYITILFGIVFVSNNKLISQSQFEILDSMAWDNFDRNNLDEAIRLSEQSLLVADSINFLEGIGKSNKTLGIFHTVINQYDKAYLYYIKALNIRKQLKDKAGIAYIYDNLCWLKKEEGDYLGAIDFGLKALEILTNLGEEKKEPSLLLNLAIVHQFNKDNEEAEKFYNLALESSLLMQDSFHLERVHYNKGFFYYQLQELDSALYSAEKVLPIAMAMRDTFIQAITYGVIGNIYSKKQKYNEALKVINHSIHLNRIFSDSLRLFHNYISLSNLYFNLEGLQKSLTFCDTASIYLKNLDRIEEKEILNRQYCKIYLKLGNIDKAYHFLEIAETLEDSIFNQEKEQGIQRLKNEKLEKDNAELSLDKKTLALERTQEKIKNQQLLGLISLLIISFLGGTYILNNRRIAKVKELDEYKKTKEIEVNQRIFEETRKLRNDLAKKIHNHVATPLTHIKRFLEPIYKQFGFNQKLASHLYQAIHIADETHVLSRDISYELRPEKIDWIDKIKLNLMTLNSITSNLKVEGLSEENFSKSQGLKISSIIGNILANVSKHSKATEVKVNIIKPKNALEIIVEDNGIGYNIEERGIGLESIYSDVEELNGKIDIKSERNKGTIVNIKIPVHNGQKTKN